MVIGYHITLYTCKSAAHHI